MKWKPTNNLDFARRDSLSIDGPYTELRMKWSGPTCYRIPNFDQVLVDAVEILCNEEAKVSRDLDFWEDRNDEILALAPSF